MPLAWLLVLHLAGDRRCVFGELCALVPDLEMRDILSLLLLIGPRKGSSHQEWSSKHVSTTIIAIIVMTSKGVVVRDCRQLKIYASAANNMTR